MENQNNAQRELLRYIKACLLLRSGQSELATAFSRLDHNEIFFAVQAIVLDSGAFKKACEVNSALGWEQPVYTFAHYSIDLAVFVDDLLFDRAKLPGDQQDWIGDVSKLSISAFAAM